MKILENAPVIYPSHPEVISVKAALKMFLSFLCFCCMFHNFLFLFEYFKLDDTFSHQIFVEVCKFLILFISTIL